MRIKSKRSLNCRSQNCRFQMSSFASIGHNQLRSFALQFNIEFKSFRKENTSEFVVEEKKRLINTGNAFFISISCNKLLKTNCSSQLFSNKTCEKQFQFSSCYHSIRYLFLISILTNKPAKHVIPPPSSHTLLFLFQLFDISFFRMRKYSYSKIFFSFKQ